MSRRTLLRLALGLCAYAALAACEACEKHVVPALPMAVHADAHDASTAPGSAPAGKAPSILFAAPDGAEYLDLGYLRELHEQGFEVDYTDRLEDLTRERL